MGGQGRGWDGGHAGVQQHDAGGGQAALCQFALCVRDKDNKYMEQLGSLKCAG